MWTHPTLSRPKVTPRVFGVVRTSKDNGRDRAKERVEGKVEVGGASVALSVKPGIPTWLCLFRPTGFISADNREGAGDEALATY